MMENSDTVSSTRYAIYAKIGKGFMQLYDDGRGIEVDGCSYIMVPERQALYGEEKIRFHPVVATFVTIKDKDYEKFTKMVCLPDSHKTSLRRRRISGFYLGSCEDLVSEIIGAAKTVTSRNDDIDNQPFDTFSVQVGDFSIIGSVILSRLQDNVRKYESFTREIYADMSKSEFMRFRKYVNFNRLGLDKLTFAVNFLGGTRLLTTNFLSNTPRLAWKETIQCCNSKFCSFGQWGSRFAEANKIVDDIEMDLWQISWLMRDVKLVGSEYDWDWDEDDEVMPNIKWVIVN